VNIIYKDLYLVTWYNKFTGSIRQILTESYDDADKLKVRHVRLIDAIVGRMLDLKTIRTITRLSADGVYIEKGSKFEPLQECDSGVEGSRFLVKMLGSRSAPAMSVLIGCGDVKEIVLGHYRRLCGKNVVINEIDYWGVYVLDEYGEWKSKLSIGTMHSEYERPVMTQAPSYKVKGPVEVYHNAKTFS